MSIPANTSFQLWKGDTLRFTMSLKNTSGSAYSISGDQSFSAAVKEKGTSTTYSMLTEITSASAGQVLVTLSASTSSLLSARKNWIYDVQMTTASSIVSTILAGNIFVTDEVTS